MQLAQTDDESGSPTPPTAASELTTAQIHTDSAVPKHTAQTNSAVPSAEIIGDRPKRVVLDPSLPGYNLIRRVCILDVDRDFTIEAVHGHDLVENKEKGKEEVTVYPHDALEVLQSLDPTLEVETLYLRPDVRQSIGALRRRKHLVDVFINLYDRADETGVKIVEFMYEQGMAFTGAGARFYDPTRMELKRLCRYNKIDTPAFAVIVEATPEQMEMLPQQLGGFPLFVKPEHGYDSVGIDASSLVHTVADLTMRVQRIIEEFGSALVERYVDGREFSVLVAGGKGNIQVFPPVEYKFGPGRQPTGASTTTTTSEEVEVPSPLSEEVSVSSQLHSEDSDGSISSRGSQTPPPCAFVAAVESHTASLESTSDLTVAPSTLSIPSFSSSPIAPTGPAFITFEDKWGSNFENRWELLDATLEASLVQRLMDMSLKLYEAFEGEGYCRFDIRLDARTNRLMVLDANPNCSLFYKDSCTADGILSMVNGWSKERFMTFLIDHALRRQREWHERHGFVVKYCEEKGFSLHAARALAEGDLVYSDEEQPLRLVTKQHAQRRWSAEEMSSFDAYAWPVGEGVYAIWDRDSSKWKPINHSCDPNCWMSGLEVRARRAILEGEELTLDYATFQASHPEFECWCGAAECRRMVRPDEYKEEWFQQRYGTHVSPYILALMGRDAMEQLQQIKKEKEAAAAAADKGVEEVIKTDGQLQF